MIECRTTQNLNLLHREIRSFHFRFMDSYIELRLRGSVFYVCRSSFYLTNVYKVSTTHMKSFGNDRENSMRARR